MTGFIGDAKKNRAAYHDRMLDRLATNRHAALSYHFP